jgi:hypothetical protein
MLQIVLILVALAFPFPPGILSHQDKKAVAKVFEKVWETFERNCEANRAVIQTAAELTVEMDSRLFVISLLGTGETRQRLGHRRLHNVRAMIESNLSRPLDQAKLITAEGERVKGPGRVEFYLGSELIIVATFRRRNADFCVDCCDWPDKRYYGLGKTN